MHIGVSILIGLVVASLVWIAVVLFMSQTKDHLDVGNTWAIVLGGVFGIGTAVLLAAMNSSNNKPRVSSYASSGVGSEGFMGGADIAGMLGDL